MLCLTVAVQARRVYIHGRVYDEAGDPVELATVNEERTLHSAMTNLKGEYSFTVNTRTDTLNLVFRMVGHETRRRTLISPPDTVQLDLLLPTTNYTLENVDVTATRRRSDGMQDISAQGIRFTADANGGSVESIIALPSKSMMTIRALSMRCLLCCIGRRHRSQGLIRPHRPMNRESGY